MLDIPTKIKYTIYKLTVRNVKNEKGGECNVGKKYENEEFLQYLEIVLKEEFIADISREGNVLCLKFVDGSEYWLQAEKNK